MQPRAEAEAAFCVAMPPNCCCPACLSISSIRGRPCAVSRPEAPSPGCKPEVAAATWARISWATSAACCCAAAAVAAGGGAPAAAAGKGGKFAPSAVFEDGSIMFTADSLAAVSYKDAMKP